MAPLTITFSDSPARSLLFVSMTTCDPRGKNIYTKRRSNDTTELEERQPPSLLGLLQPLNQQVKQGTVVLTVVMAPDYHGESSACSLGCLNITMPCDQSQWKTTTIQLRPNYSWPRPFRNEEVGHLTGQRPWPVGALTESNVNMEWVVAKAFIIPNVTMCPLAEMSSRMSCCFLILL
jgi:hypothetical protein